MEGKIIAVYGSTEGTAFIIKDDDGKLNEFRVAGFPVNHAERILAGQDVKIETTNRDIVVDDITIIEEDKPKKKKKPTLQNR